MRLLYFIFALQLFLSCSNSKNKTKHLIDFVPEHSALVVKCERTETLLHNIKTNPFVNAIAKDGALDHFKNSIIPLEVLNLNSETLLCFSNANDSLSYTLIGKYSSSLFSKDSLQNFSKETLRYNNKALTKYTLNRHAIYSTVIDSVFILSSSPKTIHEALNKTNPNTILKQLYSTLNSKAKNALIWNTNYNLPPTLLDSIGLNTKQLTNYLALDTNIAPDIITINGIAKTTDSLPKTLDFFKDTVAQENTIQHIAPSNCDGYMSVTFDSFKTFNANVAAQQNTIIDSIRLKSKALFNEIHEVGIIYKDNTPTVVLNSNDIIATNDNLLDEKNKIVTYRDIDIFNFSKTTLLAQTFSPFIKAKNLAKYCILDDYLVFATTIAALQDIIVNYQNETVFGKRDAFKTLRESLSDESSIMLVGTPQFLQDVAFTPANLESKSLKDTYSLLGLQFIYDANFAHVNGAIIQAKTKKHSIAKTKIICNALLEAPAIQHPQFVTNHISKEKDIVVQDANNTLYLISNTGKILWKKPLSGPIIGAIKQIDMYKNGRLQLAFNTSRKLYVLDRKGRDVAPFPKTFKADITQPLAVFDYDKNKNYRLLVTQGKSLFMYDARGNTVKGFTFKKAKQHIEAQPKHFRIDTKDYIVFKTKRQLYILDRTGKIRVTPKTKHNFAKTPVFIYQNKFATTTNKGEFLTVDTNGNTALVNLLLPKTHNLVCSNKTRVTFHENKLNIKGRTIDLDYSRYSTPNLFYINNKIYIAITDLDAKKIRLFDSQGKMIPNFPIFGNSAVDLANCNADPNLELVTISDPNTVTLYKIN